MLKPLLSQLDENGCIQKKLSAKKFYFLYYQMTELIPLFSYLERLNFFRDTIQSMTPLGDDFDQRKASGIRLSMTKQSKSLTNEERKQMCIEKDSPIKLEVLDDKSLE